MRGLQAKSANACIVDVGGEQLFLQVAAARDLGELAVGVSRVFDVNAHGGAHRAGELWAVRVDLGKGLVGHRGAAQNVAKRCARLQGRLPHALQKAVCLGRREVRVLQSRLFGLHGRLLLQKTRVPFLADKTDLVSERRQTLLGVVLAEEQTVFRARGHHAVGLVRPLGHQIVNQRADVASRTGKKHGGKPLDAARGVDARNQSLRGGLLVARGAVELSCTE